MKRFWALFLALCLMMSGALAQEVSSTPIATYTLPAGAKVAHLWESSVWEVPEGLEDMYRIMRGAVSHGNIYLARMKNGRALFSVSCMPYDEGRTAQDMHAMWPQIAMNIAKEGVTVNADESCAAVETLYGFEALHIRTTIGLGKPDEGIVLDAEGFAFQRDDELLEVWAVVPQEGSYAGNEAAARELEQDRADLAAFMQSLSFTGLASMALEGIAYTDPDGRFGLVIPKDCTVLSAHSTPEEVTAAYDAYTAAHPEGASVFFDEFAEDLFVRDVTLIITQDQQGLVEISASQEESYRGSTPEDLSKLALGIEQTLNTKNDLAFLLSSGETAMISGHEHTWMSFWLRNGETNVQLDVLAAVLGDAWLYEVDVFTHNGDQNLRSLLLTLVNQTMHYSPLTNALD